MMLKPTACAVVRVENLTICKFYPLMLMKIDEAKALVILADSESIEEKARACDRLAVVGGPKAVPLLASYLLDPKLSARARTALENIPDESAGDALIKALDKVKGDLLVGVAMSLGARKETDAVPKLCALVDASNDEVSLACISALGEIANGEAVTKLRLLIGKKDKDRHIAAAHAVLLAASAMTGDARQELLGAIQASELPDHIKKAAADQ